MNALTAEAYSSVVFAVMLCGALLATYVVLFLLQRVLGGLPGAAAVVLRHLREPVMLMVPATTVLTTLPVARFGPDSERFLYHGALLTLIASVGWTCMRLFDTWRDTLTSQHRVDIADNLRARQVITQVTLLRRVALLLVAITTVSAMLMTFPSVRAIGATLFASAGVAGLLLGLAARPVFTNVLAGLQVALTEPIRIDDVVVVEGEWGWIEEIRTTYVIVRIWDQRRLMLPLSYFIEKPFQNWTRRTSDLLATVMLYADYGAPVQELREQFHAILKGSHLWDGKAWAFQVTDATPQNLQLRGLMSVANSGDAWDLRCLVRERMIDYMQKSCPQCLPKTRLMMQATNPTSGPGANP